MDDEYFMREALKEAKKALETDNWPIGCVIVLNGMIIARAHNTRYSQGDVLAHAEMNALNQVKELLRRHRQEATLYTTYEPCPMCFGASILSRIKRVVCGINEDNSGAMHFRDNLPLLFKQEKFSVEFEIGVLAEECEEVFLAGKPTQKLIEEGIIAKTRTSVQQ